MTKPAITTPRPPRYLRAATRRWWLAVVTAWELDDHHIKLLTLAAETWDRSREAREVIAKDGLTVPTRDGGAKLHPAIRIEADARIAFARLLRELDLDVEPPAAEKRPPALRSIAGRT